MFLCMGFPSPLLIFPVMLAPIPQEQGQKLSPFLNLNVKEKKKKGREYSTSFESLLLLSYFLLFVQEYEHERKKNFQFDCTYLQWNEKWDSVQGNQEQRGMFLSI